MTDADAGGIVDGVPEEDRLRAALYRYLSRFLAAPPDDPLLAVAAGMRGDGSELGRALNRLAERAAQAGVVSAGREYHDLFIGIGRGELGPFASYYLTGFLNEKPLARLRADMAALGAGRADGVKEPEDHVAGVLEMMAGLIEGEFGAADGIAGQRRFFGRHVAAWAPRFFTDLERSERAVLYAPVGTVGRIFLAIEETAFAMEE
ncbi:MAG TPA: molecular chaperone TorD family protein [Arenibaculum sp.]|nr:molecular chaperone TorD family protein [Arenibaculum sp.]